MKGVLPLEPSERTCIKKVKKTKQTPTSLCVERRVCNVFSIHSGQTHFACSFPSAQIAVNLPAITVRPEDTRRPQSKQHSTMLLAGGAAASELFCAAIATRSHKINENKCLFGTVSGDCNLTKHVARNTPQCARHICPEWQFFKIVLPSFAFTFSRDSSFTFKGRLSESRNSFHTLTISLRILLCHDFTLNHL